MIFLRSSYFHLATIHIFFDSSLKSFEITIPHYPDLIKTTNIRQFIIVFNCMIIWIFKIYAIKHNIRKTKIIKFSTFFSYGFSFWILWWCRVDNKNRYVDRNKTRLLCSICKITRFIFVSEKFYLKPRWVRSVAVINDK